MKTKIITLTIIALTIMSCTNSKKTTTKNAEDKTEIMSKKTVETNNETIENTKWVISKFEGVNMEDKQLATNQIFFMLDSKTNRVTGNTGCNSIMGTYTLAEGNRITFSKMATTRMACPESKISETQITNLFETVDNYTIYNGQLSLNKAKSTPLAVFKKEEIVSKPIVEKYWRLKTLEGKQVTMADNQEREIYFTLKANNNSVVGFAGCNTINGEFVLKEGNRIQFKNMLTTLKACPDVDVNEAQFLKVFERADNYTINGDVLSLNVGKRAPLAVFEAVYMQ